MKNNSYDKKIFRLVSIITKLANRNPVTTADLAGEFKVTTRTVQRDLQLLLEAYWPICLDNGSYKFEDGFSLRKITVTPEEKFLLTIFYRLFSKVGAPFNKTANDFLNKVIIPSKNAADYTYDDKTIEIIKKEFSDFSNQLAIRLEKSEYPKSFIKKIDQYLLEVSQKLKTLGIKDTVNIQTKLIKGYENGQPVASIKVPKTYFKDKIDDFDFSTHEDKREFQIKTYLPNKFFKSFRISLELHMAFNFWGTHLKAQQITCFDKFAQCLGFQKDTKLFTYEFSHGTYSKKHQILITTASLRWEKEIPMDKKYIKSFSKKSGRFRSIAGYS